MAGWRKDALTVPDRSIAALRHPTWYAGAAFPKFFKKTSLDMMGPDHPVKNQILKQVAKVKAEVDKLGPIVGAKSAKERLDNREADEKLNGKGLPIWRAADAANRLFNPLVMNKAAYLEEREAALAPRPARCDPKIPNVRVLGLGGLFDNNLRLLATGPNAHPKKKKWP